MCGIERTNVLKSFFFRILCGFFLGISVFAPGVSGSVIAVMMGIYDRLLTVVSNPLRNKKKNIIYLFPMGIGAVISAILFFLVFNYLFDTYKLATYLLFMGLIAGNLPVVFKDACADGFKKHYIIAILVSFGIALTVGILRANAPEAQEGATFNLIYLGLSGAVAGIASMIPGMSISMILMVFGVYEYLLNAPERMDIPAVAVTAVCFIVAMIAFSRLTKFVLRRYHNFAYFMVFGFMCGSLVGIYLGLPEVDPNFNWFIGVLMILIGLGISASFVFLGKRFNVEEKEDPDEAALQRK